MTAANPWEQPGEEDARIAAAGIVYRAMLQTLCALSRFDEDLPSLDTAVAITELAGDVPYPPLA
jgi:hypothetical protein